VALYCASDDDREIIESVTMVALKGELERRIGALRSRIAHNQSGHSGRFILFTHDPHGLGGQISRRLLAIRVGLMTARTAVFPDEDFFPYENVFEPLTEATFAISKSVPPIDLMCLEGDSRPVVYFDFWACWENKAFRELVYSALPIEVDGIPDGAILLDGIIFSSFRLKASYYSRIAPYLAQIKAMGSVIGVHFRRGDKYVETPYVDSAVYRRHIEAVAARHNIKDVFISSDSPNAMRELALDETLFNIHFDVNERRYNNANHKFLIAHRELAPQETFSAIKNIYMLSCCTQIVGQTNAHFASLAAGRLYATRMDPDFGVLIDPMLAPKNWSMRLLNSIYRYSRSVGKRILPLYFLKSKQRE
jgi:hypothetical protein